MSQDTRRDANQDANQDTDGIAQGERLVLLDAQVASLRADNARLRGLLDARDMPDELRHRQRNMLATLRSIIRQSARTAPSVETYAARLQDRVDAVARVQSRLDAFGHAGLHDLVSDELLTYAVREGERVAIAGPEIRFRAGAAQAVAMALHELAMNAIEHGSLASPDGRLDVAWRRAPADPDPLLMFDWKETGAVSLVAPERRGFGAEVLDETLRFALGAETALCFEPDGLRCTIRMPLPERVAASVGDGAPRWGTGAEADEPAPRSGSEDRRLSGSPS